MKKSLQLLVLLCIAISCTNSKKATQDKIFNKLKSSRTGIEFSNILSENDSLNYFNYAYMYMGEVLL